MERHKEKGLEVTSIKEEWEIISHDQDEHNSHTSDQMSLTAVSVSHHEGANHSCSEAHASVVVHPGNDGGEQHVQLNGLSISVDA